MILKILDRILSTLPDIYQDLSNQDWDWLVKKFYDLQQQMNHHEDHQIYEIIDKELNIITAENAYFSNLRNHLEASRATRGAVPPIVQLENKVPVQLLYERVNEIIQQAHKINSGQKRKKKNERAH